MEDLILCPECGSSFLESKFSNRMLCRDCGWEGMDRECIIQSQDDTCTLDVCDIINRTIEDR
jgi:hypothetical protein